MKKALVGIVVVAALSAPVAVFADNTQLIALYQQIVMLLQQELNLLRNNALVVSPNSGAAPLTVTFTVNNSQGNEAVDFGDGHSTGSDGCVQNGAGFCDLSKPAHHTYQLPGSYKVTLYRTVQGTAQMVTTSGVTVK